MIEIFHGALILTPDGFQSELALAVDRQGIIVALDRPETLKEQHPQAMLWSYPRSLILPGFMNPRAQCLSALRLLAIGRADPAPEDRALEIAALLACGRAARAGVTSIGEASLTGADLPAEEAHRRALLIARAARRAGLRVKIIADAGAEGLEALAAAIADDPALGLNLELGPDGGLDAGFLEELGQRAADLDARVYLRGFVEDDALTAAEVLGDRATLFGPGPGGPRIFEPEDLYRRGAALADPRGPGGLAALRATGGGRQGLEALRSLTEHGARALGWPLGLRVGAPADLIILDGEDLSLLPNGLDPKAAPKVIAARLVPETAIGHVIVHGQRVISHGELACFSAPELADMIRSLKLQA